MHPRFAIESRCAFLSVLSSLSSLILFQSGADPGFPVGGRGPVWGGRGPLTQVLFSENVKTKELGPVGGGRALENFACGSANANGDAFNLFPSAYLGRQLIYL